ncbi:MAG: hypothetical protein WCE51_07630 [Chthoniobacterales bacterium]
MISGVVFGAVALAHAIRLLLGCPASAPNSNMADDITGTLKRPSAFLPIAMSLLALVIVLFHIAIYGPAQEPDEGISAHLWQLLMLGQVPIVLFFAIRWLPQAPRSTLLVLAIQVIAGLAAVGPVFILGL